VSELVRLKTQIVDDRIPNFNASPPLSPVVGVYGLELLVQLARRIRSMSLPPSIPEFLCNTVPPKAQAAFLAVIVSLEKRIADLEARLNQDSTNSSRPPSSDPPALNLKRRPPVPSSGGKRGGQPGHKRHNRALVALDQIRETFEVKPSLFRCCGSSLQGHDPEPVRHQVAEIPPVRPDVEE
jgi:transposase